MGINELISSIIDKMIEEGDIESLRFNTLLKKVEMNGNTISDIELLDLVIKIKEKMPTDLFKQKLLTPKIIKSAINDYAQKHQYTPTIKKSEWYNKINVDDKGNALKTFENVVNFITYYPKYKGRLNYNEFMCYENIDDKTITDADILAIRLNVEQELGFDSHEKVESAVKLICHQNSFNPFKDEIEKIIWDGEYRMETFFIKFLGVEDNKFNRSFTKKWFYALIKRLYEPGCPFDCMIIIYDSKQGTGKSKIVECLISSLGMNYGYDQTITCDNKDKDNVDKLNKAWIVGIDEMDDFLKKNAEQTKQFLSMSRDQARLSYARRSETYYRHCVFYGNSNLMYFLKDYTSDFERRYWVMNANGEVHDSNWWKENLPAEYCRQVLAEAKYLYDNEPDFNYNTLSIEECEWLKTVQYEHKTLNNDDLLQDEIFKVLDDKYNYDILSKDYDTWLKYVKNIYSRDIRPNDILSENLSETLTIIPVKWLKKYVFDELNRSISTQYLSALISQKWYYAKVWDGVHKCQMGVYKRYME